MGLGAICASAAARSYIVEIAPVKHRGLFLGSYNVVQNVGSIMVSGSGIGFGYMSSEWGWRGLLLVAVSKVLASLRSLNADRSPSFTVQSSTSALCTSFPSLLVGCTPAGARTMPFTLSPNTTPDTTMLTRPWSSSKSRRWTRKSSLPELPESHGISSASSQPDRTGFVWVCLQ